MPDAVATVLENEEPDALLCDSRRELTEVGPNSRTSVGAERNTVASHSFG